MIVKIADPCGFCFGVDRAVRMCEESLTLQSGPHYSLGPLVHNQAVVDLFEQKGLMAADSPSNIPEGAHAVIRAHGVTPAVIAELNAKNIRITDTTCPKVIAVQKLCKKYSEEGRKIVICGDKDHPEVIGIAGNATGTVQYITGLEDIDKLDLQPEEEAALLSQTTFNLEKFLSIAAACEEKFPHMLVQNTICSATRERQAAAKALAGKVDVMVVLGGQNSSNTKKLYQICKDENPNTVWLSEPIDFQDLKNIKHYKIAGITAGASTPQWTIKEVSTNMMSEEMNNELIQEEEREMTMEEAMAQMDEVEKAAAAMNNGDIVEGTVVAVTDTEARVDIGYLQTGILSQRDISADPSVNPKDVLKEGDKISVYIVKLEDKNGNLILSKRRADMQNVFAKAVEYMENQTVFASKITEEVKGGLVAEFEGFRAFIPASHVNVAYVPDLSIYVGQTFDVKVIEVDRAKNRVVLSRKAALEEQLVSKKKEALEKLEVGAVLEGTVKKLASFGAFIDLGGVDGLVHISELAWNKVADPSEVLTEGETVKVKVIKLNKETDKITLSIKQTLPDAWDTIDEKYAVGSIVKGTVKRLVTFGAFVELEPGVEGLVHISQIDNEHVKEAKDVLTAEQVVDVKVLNVDKAAHKIALSIKQAKPQAPRPERAQRPRREHSEGGERRGRNNYQNYNEVEENEPLTTSLGDLFGHLFK